MSYKVPQDARTLFSAANEDLQSSIMFLRELDKRDAAKLPNDKETLSSKIAEKLGLTSEDLSDTSKVEIATAELIAKAKELFVLAEASSVIDKYKDDFKVDQLLTKIEKIAQSIEEEVYSRFDIDGEA